MRKQRYRMKRMVFKLSPMVAESHNVDFSLRAPNRGFLEQSVFGYLNDLAAASYRTIKTLFVRVDEHTWPYPRLLISEFHSLDVDARKAVYRQAGKHWTGNATLMSEHFAHNEFDVVVADGLVGFGINNAMDFRRLVEQCETVLRPGGLLVLGYNDRPDRASFPVMPVVRELFDEFVPPIAGVDSAVHRVNDPFQHVYVFLKKRGAPIAEDSMAVAANIESMD